MSCCEVCGYEFEGNRKCPMSKKAHKKIEKLTKLYGDIVHQALTDDNELKYKAYSVLSSSEDEDELDKAYTSLVMAYYIRFQWQFNWESSLTFETYWGMLIHSCPDKFESRLDFYKSKYGDLVGLRSGYTYVFEDTVDDMVTRVLENSLFIARTDVDGWAIYEKKNKHSTNINYTSLPKTSSEDYIMGYAKCLAVYENWL